MKVIIHQNRKIFNHSTIWDNAWIQTCKDKNIDFTIMDCFNPNSFDEFGKYDCLLWHFNNYSLQEMLAARSLLYCAKNIGLHVFPDFNTAWHFDDKVAETWLLKSINASIPKSWTFFTASDANNWIETINNYPIIAKLRSGSGASNVKLIKSKRMAHNYIRRMFGSGISGAPDILFKTKSNLNSSKDWATFIKRIKRIPDFLETRRNARLLPKERCYTYFQEFIPNDGYDLKIVVIGKKLSFIARNVRKGDFRASGGGALFFDRNLVSQEIIQCAFETSEKLGFQCMGYDFVVDKKNNIGKIVEMSYGFSYTALIQAGGYWDRGGVWHNEPLNAPEEVLNNIVNQID